MTPLSPQHPATGKTNHKTHHNIMSNYDLPMNSSNPGVIIFLLDESSSMNDPYDGAKTKAVFAAETINAVMGQILDGIRKPSGRYNKFKLVIIGYGDDANVRLEGWIDELDSDKNRPEHTFSYIGADGQTKTITAPEFATVNANGWTNMAAGLELALEKAKSYVDDGHSSCYPPIIINVTDGKPLLDGKPFDECRQEILNMDVHQRLKECGTGDCSALLFNIHIDRVGPEIVFPHDRESLTDEFFKFLFDISSMLPEKMRQDAQKLSIGTVMPDARAEACNAKPDILYKLINFASKG